MIVYVPLPPPCAPPTGRTVNPLTKEQWDPQLSSFAATMVPFGARRARYVSPRHVAPTPMPHVPNEMVCPAVRKTSQKEKAVRLGNPA